jgi:adenylosuccinate lyase
VIARYTRPAMGAIWTDEARMEAWRRVEVAACEEMDGPTAADLTAIRAATFTVEAVSERERVTDHDVAAFVDVLGASAGEAGRWVHFGLTSSDVLDTALALQLRGAGDIVLAGARELVDVLIAQARAHVDTVCVGRTHGVHAEPTTFGIKLAGFAMEAHRNLERLDQAFGEAAVGAISGAVGTYSATSPQFEADVLARLDLDPEPVSTQVVPRDRHAALLQAIALAGAGLERLATEIRHLQRTEVREAQEPFRSGEQKGSSAMPHKRNPITTERITGLARVLRGYAQAGVENVALWHERDISHSGAERIILPDATILLDYMQSLAIRVTRDLVVDKERMAANIDLTRGALFSQRVLLALVADGLPRDDAYRIVQESAQQAWDSGVPLRELLAHQQLKLDLDEIFDLSHYTRHAAEIVGRLDAIADGS